MSIINAVPAAVPVPPSFDPPFNFAGHKQALLEYAHWLMDAVLDQPTEKPDYTVHDAALRALQLDELKDGLTQFTDKSLKETRDEFSGYFAQFLQDSGQENARINVPGFGTRMVYKRETTTYKADDPIALTSFIRHNPEHIDMLQVRVAKEAAEQAHDAVFSLLRWPVGEFAFVVDELDPDDLGATLPVEEVVAEGERRLAAWAALVEHVPAPDAAVSVNPAPVGEPVADRDEWALLSLVDGRRTVTDLVALSGRGEYAVVSALAGLVGRGLLTVGTVAEDQLARRQSLLAALEGRPAEPVPAPRTAPPAAAPAPAATVAPVIPERPEPFTPPRRPDHAEDAAPAYARSGATLGATGARPTTAGSHGSVQGATALQPEAVPYIERDPSVNKSLLLRLIAGVRGL